MLNRNIVCYGITNRNKSYSERCPSPSSLGIPNIFSHESLAPVTEIPNQNNGIYFYCLQCKRKVNTIHIFRLVYELHLTG